MNTRSPLEAIRQRRGQMVVHSYLYYRLNRPIISDATWQLWASELVALQHKHPELMEIGYYDKEFSDWAGETGMHLPADEGVHGLAMYLLRITGAEKTDE